MARDGRRGGRDNNGSSKEARNGKGRRGAGMSGYAGRSELDTAIKDMLKELDEAIQGMLQEYDGILKESPSFIKPLFEGTLHKHEAATKGMMEKHKTAINAILEVKGMPDEEYMVKIERMLEEFDVAIRRHLSKKYLLNLMCKTVAEQMKEAIVGMFRARTH